MIGDPPKGPDRKEIGRAFQVGKEGVSHDYFNEYGVSIGHCKALLGEPEFAYVFSYRSVEELKKIVLKNIKEIRSYTEYMNNQKMIQGLKLSDFLTPRGKEIVRRLDEIATETKNFIVKNPEKLDVGGILKLFEEGKKLIYE